MNCTILREPRRWLGFGALPSNHALEQAAIPSRSWHRRQEANSKGPARQERAGSPLLTAGVTQILFVVHERLTRRRALQGIISLPVG
jgi:hypothetical protein